MVVAKNYKGVFMPIYEYTCKDCANKFDVVGSFHMFVYYEPVCPICGGKNIKKLISLSNIVFKGKGFYSNDKDDK